jgi:glycosyltransferase involved in cell wall biosynthesis
VVPFFNRIEYFEIVYRSLLSQTDTSFEVLIIDDSGDQLVQKFFGNEQLDQRFTLVSNAINKGSFESWNTGLNEMANRQKYSLLSIVHADPMFVVAVIACPGCRLSFTWQIGLSNHLRTFAACNFAHKQQTLGVEAITRPVRVRTRRTVDFKCRVLDALINFERDSLFNRISIKV